MHTTTPIHPMPLRNLVVVMALVSVLVSGGVGEGAEVGILVTRPTGHPS